MLKSVATEDIANLKHEMIYLVIRWLPSKNHTSPKIFTQTVNANIQGQFEAIMAGNTRWIRCLVMPPSSFHCIFKIAKLTNIMHNIRKQLSLYVPAEFARKAARQIEAVRKLVDPIQRNLIPAHITLCREDELQELAIIKARLAHIALKPITLRFGKPEGFSGHGLLLNCIDGEDQFRLLREYLLESKNIRNQSPHITLAHPRNPKSTGNSLFNTSRLPEIIEITFPTIYLIEQAGNAPWRVLETYELPS